MLKSCEDLIRYLCVSHTSCSSDRLLRCLPFSCGSLIVVERLWVRVDFCSPVLAQQDIYYFCMALQCGVDQRTLATLISLAHLAQRRNTEGLIAQV